MAVATTTLFRHAEEKEKEEEESGGNNNKKLIRFKSVRTKPTSFSSWRHSVKTSCSQDDNLDLLCQGTYLWKIRRKKLQGITGYRRKFRLDMDQLCLHYSSESSGSRKFSNFLSSSPSSSTSGSSSPGCSSHVIDLADIVEVRQGFSTDTFNEVEKKMHQIKLSSDCLYSDNCFSVIFDPKLSVKSLDLVAEDTRTKSVWVMALNRIVNATKSIEIQKEYELYLRNQFHAADENESGDLTLNEFATLLQQLNINLTEAEILKIFDEVNTDRTEIDGEQVIDEQEFLEFYHNLLERDALNELFKRYSARYQGLAMTISELKRFLSTEQDARLSEEECKMIIAEFEPSPARRKRHLFSPEGFSRFFMFSDLQDLIDIGKTEAVYQVRPHKVRKHTLGHKD